MGKQVRPNAIKIGSRSLKYRDQMPIAWLEMVFGDNWRKLLTEHGYIVEPGKIDSDVTIWVQREVSRKGAGKC